MPPVPRDVSLVSRGGSPLRRRAAAGRGLGSAGFVAAGAVAVLLGLLIGGALARTTGSAPTPPGTETGTATAVRAIGVSGGPASVRYEVVGGAARALVTYGADHHDRRANGVALPWRGSGPARPGSTYALTAQATSAVGERITCRITVDGVVIAEQTSSARSTVVACSGADER